MIFHLGVLKHLADCGELEHVERVSTVSGGSLLIGLVFQECGLQWPTSKAFLERVYPSLRLKLCSRSLVLGAVCELLRPSNWRFVMSRANVLASVLRREWHVTARMADLAAVPEWSINATTAENGKRFRFKRDSLGDYSLGYAEPGNFPLASAIAVSAAFPGFIGPLVVDATRFVWKKRPTWGAPESSAVVVQPEFHRLHLYDGGIYDNLGLEPFFDAGNGVSKQSDCFILVSDAGAPLTVGFGFWALSVFRLTRVADIMSDQARALRVRTFMSYLAQGDMVGERRGAYVYIGMPANPEQLVNGAQPARFPTTLRRVSEDEFDGIAAHGYHQAASPVKPYGPVHTVA